MKAYGCAGSSLVVGHSKLRSGSLLLAFRACKGESRSLAAAEKMVDPGRLRRVGSAEKMVTFPRSHRRRGQDGSQRLNGDLLLLEILMGLGEVIFESEVGLRL